MNLNIFYHQHAINDYQERFDNTYKKIVDSGLIKKIDKIYVNTDAAKIDNYYKVVSTYNERFTSESPTLMRLKEYAKSNSGCSLYLHSKGVTKPTSDKVQDWINMMEYFTIIKHSECLLNLEIGYNAVGVNYIDAVYYKPPQVKRYDGTFWWANNKYLATLPYIAIDEDRAESENWIGRGEIIPKVLHQSNVDHYFINYPPSKYQ